MADFYLNHNVSRELGDWLRHAHHSARTADDIGRAQATDDEHFLIAQQQGWILVTHNWKDFKLLHDAWRRWFGAHWPDPVRPLPSHPGILVIPAPDWRRGRWLPEQAAREIEALLTSGASLADALYRWQTSLGWRRH